MTPPAIARFMANLFPQSDVAAARLLDAGAGRGSLSRAFLDRWATGGFSFPRGEIWAFEYDTALTADLDQCLTVSARSLPVEHKVIQGDFIEKGAKLLREGSPSFTHAILNPPYKKIGATSFHRLLLTSVGLETVNLYSAFVGLSLMLLAPGGLLVAIIPRSFCNGPYYRPFRELLLSHAALLRVHLFGSRSKAFRSDDVLQENVIILLQRDAIQGPVTISTSTDATFDDLALYVHDFEKVVQLGDNQRFIHIPSSDAVHPFDASTVVCCSLEDIGIAVSTGPVVDFRVDAYLCDSPEQGTAPLLYPSHFQDRKLAWPRLDGRKPNSIRVNDETAKLLYPTGFYCVVRRFSAKEERRRLVPSVVDPNVVPDAPLLGFENHLNVFHANRRGIPKALAYGLSAFLGSTAADDQFRRFNGHTQVNATDLRIMKYPSREALLALGEWMITHGDVTQALLDEKMTELVT